MGGNDARWTMAATGYKVRRNPSFVGERGRREDDGTTATAPKNHLLPWNNLKQV